MEFDDTELAARLFAIYEADIEYQNRERQEHNAERFEPFHLVNTLLMSRLARANVADEMQLDGHNCRLLETFPLISPTRGAFKGAELAMVISGDYYRTGSRIAVIDWPVKIILQIQTERGMSRIPLAALRTPKIDETSGLIPNYGLTKLSTIEQRLTYDVAGISDEMLDDETLTVVMRMIIEADQLERADHDLSNDAV